MQIDFAFLADSATHRPDGRIDATAIGPFVVAAAHFPAHAEHFAVVTRVGFEPEDAMQPASLRVGVVAPDGTRVAEQTSTVEAPPVIEHMAPHRTRTRVLNFFNVALPQPGTYHCRITLNDTLHYINVYFDATQSEGAIHADDA